MSDFFYLNKITYSIYKTKGVNVSLYILYDRRKKNNNIRYT
jgi:hypothetical protein